MQACTQLSVLQYPDIGLQKYIGIVQVSDTTGADSSKKAQAKNFMY